MNNDEFEQELRRQPLRPIPVEWRRQILDSAIGREPPVSVREWSLVLRELFWPSPRAWAGLAATWALILILNGVSGDSVIARSGQTPAAQPSTQLLMALQEQRQLWTDLMDLPDSEESPKTKPAQPRSDASNANFNA